MISGNESLWEGIRTRAGPPRSDAHVAQVPLLLLGGAFVNS